jgi:hypothetical protein
MENNACEIMKETAKLLMIDPSQAEVRATIIHAKEYLELQKLIGQENMPPFRLTFQPSRHSREQDDMPSHGSTL